jgi:hypothetical protein
MSLGLKVAITCWLAKGGINLETESSNENFPSSHNIITATVVTAFVCDAIRKIHFYPAALSYLHHYTHKLYQKRSFPCGLWMRQHHSPICFLPIAHTRIKACKTSGGKPTWSRNSIHENFWLCLYRVCIDKKYK